MATKRIPYTKGDVKASIELVLSRVAAINNKGSKIIGPEDDSWEFVEENGDHFVVVETEPFDD